uniref:hypothetical protein n=1 Tax=Paractinoplanes polyasparticus TaxID=2856853 RepID=UPI001C846558|nr:hypothetical protein [Actinoplanes polyasparticus]
MTGAAGGISGVLAMVGAFFEVLMDNTNTPVAVALIGAAALVLSATAIAPALFVKADVESRGVATAARNTGRAAVAAAFLHATAALPASPHR